MHTAVDTQKKFPYFRLKILLCFNPKDRSHSLNTLQHVVLWKWANTINSITIACVIPLTQKKKKKNRSVMNIYWTEYGYAFSFCSQFQMHSSIKCFQTNVNPFQIWMWTVGSWNVKLWNEIRNIYEIYLVGLHLFIQTKG